MALEGASPREAIVITGLYARRVATGLVPALMMLQEQGLRILTVHPLEDHGGVETVVGLARERGVTLVIAAGGDGTVGAAVNCLAGTDLALGVLPLGTSNDFARSLDLPLTLREACRTIAHGHPRRIDLGLMTTDEGTKRYFVHAASVGLNSRFALLATRPEWRRRYGRMAYAAAALEALRNRQAVEMRITEDGKHLHGRVLQATAINAPVFGGSLAIRVPDGTLTDRRLDLILIGEVHPRALLQALRVLSGDRVRRVPFTYFAHPRRLRIETDLPQAIACDGELIGRTPVTMESADRALTVIG
jgi:YegS/Rv2252/BmrU family lipid kinase